jgi:putative oxidoreductase
VERWLLLSQIPSSPNVGRLVLRVFVFLMLFWKHGSAMLFTFGALSQNFPDPLHIGPVPTLVIAAVADGICSLLIVAGLFTRWAALYSFLVHLVAFVFVQQFVFISREAPKGEQLLMYMGCSLALYFLGAGKFSIDAMIDRARGTKLAPIECAEAAQAY